MEEDEAKGYWSRFTRLADPYCTHRVHAICMPETGENGDCTHAPHTFSHSFFFFLHIFFFTFLFSTEQRDDVELTSVDSEFIAKTFHNFSSFPCVHSEPMKSGQASEFN